MVGAESGARMTESTTTPTKANRESAMAASFLDETAPAVTDAAGPERGNRWRYGSAVEAARALNTSRTAH